MKTLLPLLVLLYATAAYAGRQAQVDVPDSSAVNVTISPTTQPEGDTKSAQVVINPNPWTPVRDALIYALIGIIAAGGPVVVIWIRALGKRLEAAESNATTSRAESASATVTANQALAASPPPVPGGRRASDPPATVPPPADPLGTLPVFRQRPDEGLKP
jgi:hypothetical protein